MSRTVVMPFGQYKGQTLDAIATAGDRAYLEWIARVSSNKRIKAAAASFLESTASERNSPLLAMPATIAADTSLSPGAKLVFAAIWTAADQDPDQRCTLSNDDLQAQTGLSSKQVKRLLVELESLGLIARVVSGGRRSHILVTWTTAWPATASEGTPCPRSEGTSRPPWQDHFDAARSEDIRKPIRGSIKRREDGAQAKDRDQAMDDYFWRKAPDRKQAKPGRFTPDDPPELRPQDYTPEDWAELQASTPSKPPWED